MAVAMAYALRRTSARLVVLVGFGGLLWMVWVAWPYRPPGVVANYPIWFLPYVDPYRIVGSGFSAWDLAAGALVAVVAAAVGALLWYDRSPRR